MYEPRIVWVSADGRYRVTARDKPFGEPTYTAQKLTKEGWRLVYGGGLVEALGRTADAPQRGGQEIDGEGTPGLEQQASRHHTSS